MPPGAWHSVYTPVGCMTSEGHFLSCDAMHLTYITYKFTTPLPDSSTDNPMWGVSIAQAKDSSHARSIGK